MANIVPGALWRPIDVGARARRTKGRGAIAHVAVSEQTLLVPGPLATRGADWTFYLPKQPYASGQRFAQLIDMDLQCWSSAAGNATCPAWESQGGVVSADSEPWTDNQLEAGAMIYAYGMETEGWPAQIMPNSLAGSRGLGYHRLGIDPWRVSGGQVWSSSRGKICPGTAKINGLLTMLDRAVQLYHGSPSPAPQPTPTPAPPPPPPAGRPTVFGWNLPSGHYYGNVAGPAASHGGYYASERDEVQNIQRWFIYRGCVPGIAPQAWGTSGWADGKWEVYTDNACALWHDRFYPGQPYRTRVYADDYRHLTA